MPRKLLVILGATAVGKSALAVELARAYNGEVISADSRQVYRGADIGTGKITAAEMRGVRHHLLDVVSPTQHYSVEEWRKAALGAIDDITEREKLPIVCGGTGFYIQALVDNVSFPEVPPNKEFRNKLEGKSASELFGALKAKDERRAREIDAHNPRRLIRALEIADALGKVPEQKSEPLFDTLQIGIQLSREILREKISLRLEKRLNDGMIEEAKTLHANGLSFERMDELGLEYRYLALFLKGELSYDEMKTKLATEIYRYAKRQETWFKRDKRIVWFSPEEREEIFDAVENFLED
jgi:tRNA dimethylallyltransferase